MNSEIYCWVSVESTSRSVVDINAFDSTPDQVWSIGDKLHGTLLRRKTNGISFKSRLPISSSLREHVLAVLSRFSKNDKARFRRMKHVMITLHIAIYDIVDPPIYLEPDLLNEIASIGAALDVDVYNLGGTKS